MADKEHPNVAGVRHRAAVKEQQVAEYYEREAAMKPTPTQEENDLARVGALDIDNKEDDGSPWDYETKKRMEEGRTPSGNAYLTRDMDPSAPQDVGDDGQPRARGPGRPRRSE